MVEEMSGKDSRFPDEEPEIFPRVFGNYLLLHRLARGGMGEVYLAKTGGLAGIEKHSVVKTLRPHFTSDREYVTRFIDEARVVVGLTHRNICQVFDVGRVGRQYYLAMEYIPGMDLRSIQDRWQERKGSQILDEALIIHACCEVLEALDYAHRAKNPTTLQPLHLVHRDISPQNVMVNFEGEVKLIDFGLAQSTQKEEQTQPHMVMGKMAYMSPEQARGEPIDASADQFAVAVVLYEMLTGERYYGQMSPEQIWAVAGRGDWVPPRIADLPRDLTKLLKRGLDPDRSRRYASCGDFREDLVGYQYSRGMRAGSRELRALMQELYPVEQEQHADLVAHYAGVSIADFASPSDEPWTTPSGKVQVPSHLVEETISFVPSRPHPATFLELPASSPGTTSDSHPKKGEATGETTRVPRSPSALATPRGRLVAAAVGLVALLLVGIIVGIGAGGDPADDLIVVTAEPIAEAAPDAEPAVETVEARAAEPTPPPAAPVERAESEGEKRRGPSGGGGRRSSSSSKGGKGGLPASAAAQHPQRLIEKLAFLKEHCLDRVPCARKLTNTHKLDSAELEQLHKQGEFDRCIKKCKE